MLLLQSVPKEDDGSHDGPWMVRMQLQLRIATASLKLIDDSRAAVLTTSMHALEIEMLVSRRPATLGNSNPGLDELR